MDEVPATRKGRRRELDNETKTKDGGYGDGGDEGDAEGERGGKRRNVTGRFETCKCRIRADDDDGGRRERGK